MEMDAEKMLDKNITMDDIHFAISNSYDKDVQCVYSDYNSSNLVFRLRISSAMFNKQKNKQKVQENNLIPLSDDIYLLRNFQESMLQNVVLRGINNISNVNVRKLQNQLVRTDGGFERKDVFVLDTAGTNLLDVLAMDYIDSKRTISNDIKEVFNVLGLEAARQLIHDEFVDVMEFSGVSINYHHLSLLCDRMTLTKNMVSIFRSGILNDDIGPISKSTFEVHTEVLLNASRHGEFDDMRGVSANVMMGQVGPYGTGMFGVVLDMAEMAKMKSIEYKKAENKEDVEKLLGKTDDVCSNTKIENNLHAMKIDECTMDDDGFDLEF